MNIASYLLVERNNEDQVWRAIVVTQEDGVLQIDQAAEDAVMSVAVDYAIRTARIAPTHIKLPNGEFDDGGELTLAEAAELAFI